jgi:hypothetical protein
VSGHPYVSGSTLGTFGISQWPQSRAAGSCVQTATFNSPGWGNGHSLTCSHEKQPSISRAEILRTLTTPVGVSKVPPQDTAWKTKLVHGSGRAEGLRAEDTRTLPAF